MRHERMEQRMDRRGWFHRMAGSAAVLAAMKWGGPKNAQAQAPSPAQKRKGRIRQSVSRWCFGNIPLDAFCRACVEMGIGGVDLLDPKDWPTLKQFGLVGTCTPTHGLAKGLNRKENHAECLAKIRAAIEATSAAGFPNVICFPGNREGLSDEEGAAVCVEGLKQVAGLAEEKNVTVVMELLNSKVNHKDYQADRTAWAVDVCKRVGSPRVKVLYDIYHMQIMEGDVIRTIQQNIKYIGHFHTAGNPGRHEFDDTQELNYQGICRAIADLGFQGCLAHEYTPTREPIPTLEKMLRLCEV